MNRGKAQNLRQLTGWIEVMAELNLRLLNFWTADDMNSTDINHVEFDFYGDLEGTDRRRGVPQFLGCIVPVFA